MKHIRYVFIAVILLAFYSITVHAEQQKVIWAGVQVTKEEAHLTFLSLRYGQPEKELDVPSENYMALYDEEGKIAFKQPFFPSFTILIESNNSEEEGRITETEKYPAFFRFPYPEKIKYLSYVRNGEVISLIDLNESLCNHNSECDGFENYLSCSDCGESSHDSYCEAEQDNVCDADCKPDEDSDCTSPEEKNEPVCGDGICSNETAENCPEDCPAQLPAQKTAPLQSKKPEHNPLLKFGILAGIIVIIMAALLKYSANRNNQ